MSPATWYGGLVRAARRLLLLGAVAALAATGFAATAASASPAAPPPAPVRSPGKPLAGKPASVKPLQGKPRAVHAAAHGHVTATGRTVSLRTLAKLRPAAHASRSRAGQGGHVLSAHASPPGVIGPDASITTNFDGISQAQAVVEPPDPSAATNGSQILTVTNFFVQVYDNNGQTLCGGGVLLPQLLGTTDSLTDPRVEYDNANGHFILTVSFFPLSSTATPAMYVAVTTGSNACGPWTVFRPTFSFSDGNFLDEPMLGQDAQSVLLSVGVGNLSDSGASDEDVFAIPKFNLYSNVATDFPVFSLGDTFEPEPVTNAGNPMISTSASYFVVPGVTIGSTTGYALYQMIGSGSSNPTLTLQALILAPYVPPAPAPQPGTGATIDTGDGRIGWSLVSDGSRIWFAQAISVGSGIPPTVRYGFFSPGSGTIQMAQARHSSTSADFNPSIGIGLNPGGLETVFLNWAYTDVTAGTAVSDTADSFIYSGGTLPNRIGTDQTLVSGTASIEDRFGDFSSVAPDPAVSDGTCAVTAQQYFTAADNWATRIARVCGQSQTVVPNVLGDSVSDARTALSAALLRGDSLSTTTACDNASQDLVVGSSPPPGQVTGIGSEVTLLVCDRRVRVPGVIGDTVDIASAVIRSAGLAVGTISSTTSCDVARGEVASTSPRAGNLVMLGSAVNLRASSGPPKLGCQ